MDISFTIQVSNDGKGDVIPNEELGSRCQSSNKKGTIFVTLEGLPEREECELIELDKGKGTSVCTIKEIVPKDYDESIYVRLRYYYKYTEEAYFDVEGLK